MKFRPVLWVALIALLVFAAACKSPQIDLPSREVPVTEEAVQRFEKKIAAIKTAPPGDVKLTFTESEITSYINLRLMQENLPLQHPTLWFSAGRVYLKGHLEVENLPVKGDAILVAALSVREGQVSLQVEEAIIGRVPVPQSVLNRLSALANEHLHTFTGPLPIKDLQILEGEAIVVLSR